MTEKEKIKELEKYTGLKTQITRLQENIDGLRDKLMSPSGKTITWAPVTPKRDDKFAGTMARIDEIEREMREKLDECTKLRLSIERAINSVSDPTLYNLLCSRYIQGKTWEEVGKDIGYSTTSVKRLHKKALRKMDYYGPSKCDNV